VSNTASATMRKLELIVEGGQAEPIMVGALYPPCFESLTQYRAWVDSTDPELGSEPPPRKDWPGEPNYCRDCNRGNRNNMRQAGRCLFPDTVFITVGTGQDEEVVGTSR
jgi:hypothetical protein